MLIRRLKNLVKHLARSILHRPVEAYPLSGPLGRLRTWAYSYPYGPLRGQFSQYGQDTFVAGLFGWMRNGTFLDIGAYDGIDLSNTYFFERDLGWTGVCIEPHPDVYQRLIQNRTCICVNVAAAAEASRQPFVRATGKAEMFSGLRNHHRSVERAETYAAEHNSVVDVIDIECRRIDELLASHGVSKVDFLSLDIEGNELEVLETIDPSAFGIQVICVENNYPDRRIERWMRSAGFRLEGILGGDEIYQRRGRSPSPLSGSDEEPIR